MIKENRPAIKLIKKYYKEYRRHNRNKFKRRLKRLERFFGSKHEFKKNVPPMFFRGDFSGGKPKYVLIGLNPHYEDRLKEMYARMSESWHSYLSCLDYCSRDSKSDYYYYERSKFRYFKQWYKLLKRLEQKKRQSDNIDIFLRRNVLNLNILPFTSTQTKLGYKSGLVQEIDDYLNVLREILDSARIRIILTHGNATLQVLFRSGFFSFDHCEELQSRKGEICFGTYKDKADVVWFPYIGGRVGTQASEKFFQEIANKIKRRNLLSDP